MIYYEGISAVNDQEKIINELDTAEKNEYLNETLITEETKEEENSPELICPEPDELFFEEIESELETDDPIPDIADSACQDEIDAVADEMPAVSYDDVLTTDAKEIDDEEPYDTILPPDEIFSVPLKKKQEEPELEPVLDECLDEDGQYRFPEIGAPEPKDDQEGEVTELDYSEPTQEKYDEKKPRKIDGKFDFVELFVFTFLAVILVTTFLFKHSVVDGVSMEQTLSHGEHLIISDLFYTPKRGDIIVCEDYTTAIRKPIVKRVIGVEGDIVSISSDGTVTVNDKVLNESYVFIDDPTYVYRPITAYKVPEGELFVMGDHRNMSSDSREIGTVSEESVLGKVILRFYPFNKFGTVK